MSQTRMPPRPARKPTRMLGVLPYIGLMLFTATALPIVFGDHRGNWQQDLVQNGVVYLIGWAGVGAGVAHIFFSRRISASIGWAPSPFELEVGSADLGLGVAALLATSYPTDYWLGLIIASSIFRVGCGFGHVRQMVREQDDAINNTHVLVANFAVPAFLLLAYHLWT